MQSTLLVPDCTRAPDSHGISPYHRLMWTPRIRGFSKKWTKRRQSRIIWLQLNVGKLRIHIGFFFSPFMMRKVCKASQYSNGQWLCHPKFGEISSTVETPTGTCWKEFPIMNGASNRMTISCSALGLSAISECLSGSWWENLNRLSAGWRKKNLHVYGHVKVG